MTFGRGIVEKHPDLTVLDPRGRSTISARDADRMFAFLQEARLIQVQNAKSIADPLHDIIAANVAGMIGIPKSAPEHRLHAPGRFIAHMFGQLPTVLRLHPNNQAVETKPGPAPASPSAETSRQAAPLLPPALQTTAATFQSIRQ